MDFVTGLPPSKRFGVVYDAIWVVVDRYTKMARYIPTTKTLTATGLADLFVDQIVRFFGLPAGIVTDCGSVFTSQFWSEFCYAAKVKRRLSTAFHPQTDGQTERQNQTLEQYLRAYIGDQQDQWTTLLPLAEFAYNNSEQPTLKMSPFYACYGFHPRIECEPVAPSKVPGAAERIDNLAKVRALLEEHWIQATTYQEKYYNAHHRPQAFREGDQVLLSTKHLRLRIPSRKLAPRFVGPFRVIAAVGQQAYRLELPNSMPVHPVFHTSKLRPYHHRTGDPETLPGPIRLEEGDAQGQRYEVEVVLNKRRTGQGVQYLVKWTGWPDEYNEWVSQEDMDKDLVLGYKEGHAIE